MDWNVLFFFVAGFALASFFVMVLFHEKRKQSQLHLQLNTLQTTLDIERQQFSEKLALLEQAKQVLKMEFQQTGQKILDSSNQQFTVQQQQHFNQVMHPLKEQIKEFEKKIAETYDKESRDRLSLFHEISHLKTLNQQMSDETKRLTQALKGNAKTQGIWGEMILETILEKSGLVKGREYETQVRLAQESGKMYQPDVIVHLPDQKDVIIDAKVSLTAYERYCASQDKTEQEIALREHLLSLQTHIKLLSDKDYQKLSDIKTLDFVLLFVPIETALSIALQEDSSLLLDALHRNIILVTPSTLLLALRTIQNMWQFEYQNKNAQVIAVEAGKLIDKLVAFVKDIEDIGIKLNMTKSIYDEACKKLYMGNGCIVGRAEKFKKLGAKTTKQFSESIKQAASLALENEESLED